MTGTEDRKALSTPLKKGYRPDGGRGYEPKGTPSPAAKPPQGGSGAMPKPSAVKK